MAFGDYHGGRRLKKQTKGPELNLILEDVAKCFNQSVEEIRSIKGKKKHTSVKRIYCYVARLITNAPLRAVGAVMNTDHSMVEYHRGVAMDLKKVNDPGFMDEWYDYIEKSKIWRDYSNDKFKK